MKKISKNLFITFICSLGILTLMLGSLLGAALAQTAIPGTPTAPPATLTSPTGWVLPVNLSRSGAAQDPVILNGPNGIMQAFWIDKFDGLSTAAFSGGVWSQPVSLPVPAVGLSTGTVRLKEMPQFVVDLKGQVHVFWFGAAITESSDRGVLYNRLAIGTTKWAQTQQLVQAALIFDVTVNETGLVQVAYIRSLRSVPTDRSPLNIPPGVYVRSSSNGGVTWQAAVQVQSSTYYRILTKEQATLNTTLAYGAAFLTWYEPRLGQYLYAESADNGLTWTPPSPMGTSSSPISDARITGAPQGQVFRIFQDLAQPGCILYQQEMKVESTQLAVTPGVRQPATAPVTLSGWGEPYRILESLETCPTGDRLVWQAESLFWLIGEGTSRLSLSAWDAQELRWSLPQAIEFQFTDAETQRLVSLGNLHGAPSIDGMAAIGIDTGGGDAWATTNPEPLGELTFSALPAWQQPVQLSANNQAATSPIVVVDASGRKHAVWVQDTNGSLFYTYSEGLQTPVAVKILQSAKGEIVRQPALAVDHQDRLHLAWSGGENGEIFYTRAQVAQAGSAAGWLPAVGVGLLPGASQPQIAVLGERVHILFVTPYNEQRGVYLVSSGDGGATWGAVSKVFDAAAADWDSVHNPAMVVLAGGNLATAFTRGRLAGAQTTQGVFFSSTKQPPEIVSPAEMTPAAGESITMTVQPVAEEWSQPEEIAPAGADWPRLAVAGTGLHLIYASASGLARRALDLAQPGTGWGSVERIPGWQELAATSASPQSSSTAISPFGMAADATSIHLVSTLAGGTGLRYSVWTSVAQSVEGRWSRVEELTPAGQWENLPGMTAYSPETGGELAIAWLALPAALETGTPVLSVPGVYLSSRAIPQVTAPAYQPAGPLSVTTTVTPTEALQGTPVDASTPTPPVNLNSPEVQEPAIPPLALGAGLAAIIVVVIFAGILLRGRR